MPWRCPACSTVIRHNAADSLPDIGVRYRCHVCRLTLDFDSRTNKLTIASFETDHQVEDDSRPRIIPPPISDRRKRRRSAQDTLG